MRILVLSNLYPPVAFGGYEVECSAVVDHLRGSHEVIVLTSSAQAHTLDPSPFVRRELPLLSGDARGALRAPIAAIEASKVTRRILDFQPDIAYVWNASGLPLAMLPKLADSVPLAFRVCEHWFGRMFGCDQYMRELLSQHRGPARRVWSAGCRALNRLPSLQLDPSRRLPAAISWNSEAIRRMAGVPAAIEPALEQICHSVPRHGDLYAAVRRDLAPTPEIAFVGRVTPVKGVSVAIEALALLSRRHGIEATLRLLGPADRAYRDEMVALSRRLGVERSVSWQGQRSPEQIAAALARAHALIVPSVWDEPFPLVTIEGALARVPLVAADVGGIGEGMRDEDHALLFARGDASSAASALARTLREGERTAERVERARARAEDFRLAPYLERQQAFIEDAFAALRVSADDYAATRGGTGMTGCSQ